MAIVYLTLDEVNRDLAARYATVAEVQLELLELRDDLAPCDAVLYDLDFLPPDYRDRLLAEKTIVRSDAPIAVHGYNLTAGQRGKLRRRGVIVARRLCVALFARLAEVGRLATSVMTDNRN